MPTTRRTPIESTEWTLRVVNSVEQVVDNIFALNEHLSLNPRPQEFRMHPKNAKVWYAVSTEAGWQFGPSRFVGYTGMTPELYLHCRTHRRDRQLGDKFDGRVTEKALQPLSSPVEPGEPLHGELAREWRKFLKGMEPPLVPGSIPKFRTLRIARGDVAARKLIRVAPSRKASSKPDSLPQHAETTRIKTGVEGGTSVSAPGNFWTDDTSVLFTSFTAWTPETWGTLSWTDKKARADFLEELSDPFVAAIYVTKDAKGVDSSLKGKVVGFMLVTHEEGHRDDFSHRKHHDAEPERWKYALRAARAFNFVPEHRIKATEVGPDLQRFGRIIGRKGIVLENPGEIANLRERPWYEVEIYSREREAEGQGDPESSMNMVRAGPAAQGTYTVSANFRNLPHDLYVMKLGGSADDFLGCRAGGRKIYKIGLSKSPEARRETFQKHLPNGAFRWRIVLASSKSEFGSCPDFFAARDGEYAMKEHLAKAAKHLGGEFYLAKPSDIQRAWQLGHKVVKARLAEAATT